MSTETLTDPERVLDPVPLTVATGGGSQPEQEPADERPGMRRRIASPVLVLLVASGGSFTVFLDGTIVNTVFPEIERSFSGTSLSTLSWIFNAYSIVMAALLVPAGRIADVLGRRRLFRIGLVGFVVGSLLCAVAPTVGLLIGARIVQAMGGAMLIPTSLAIVLDAFPSTSRARAVALWTATTAVATGLGPSAGGLLVELWSWRLAFLVNLPIGIAVWIATGRVLVESRAPGRQRFPDLAGSALLASAIALLVLVVTQSNDWGLRAPQTVLALVGAVAAGTFFVRRSMRHRSPLVDLALLSDRKFAAANALSIVAGAAFYAYLLCNVLFLTTVWHYSVLEAGLALTPAPFFAAAVSEPVAKAVVRFGYALTLAVGATIWAGGVLWLILVLGPEPAFFSQWLPAIALLGIGAGISIPVLSGSAVAAGGETSFATSIALNGVSRQIGAALGIATLVAIVGTPGPADVLDAFDNGWTMSVVCLALVAVGSSLIRGISPVAEEPVEEPRHAYAPISRPLLVTAGAGAVGRLSAFFADAAAPKTETLLDVLVRAPFFGNLPASAVAGLAGHAREVTVPQGHTVYEAGADADTIYVVRAGRVDLRRRDGGLTELGRGSVLGAVTAMARVPYAETATASRDTELVAVPLNEFLRVAVHRPDFSLKLLTETSRRLEAAPRTPSRTPAPAVVALIPIGADVRIRDFASRLSDACGRLGSSGLFFGTERRADAATMTQTFGPLLAASERDNDRTLLVGGLASTDPWNAFCLRHADRVLAVATPDSRPENVDALVGADLVVLGDGPASPELVAALRPRTIHHVGGDPDDVDRIARRIAGRSIGVVLAGGGARAFAHLGAVSELLASGLKIDRFGGTSMGSFVAALFAMGMSSEEADAAAYDFWVRGNPFSDFTTPKHALLRGKVMEQMGDALFGGRRIEDLPRNFFCVATDIRAQEKVVLRDGDLRQAVAASMSLPILVPPRMDGRRILVDGALLDNLPVEDMANTGEGPVLAIDIKAQGEPSSPRPARTDGRPPRPPMLADTLSRVFWLASANTSAQAAAFADRYMEVRVGAVGLLEFHQIDVAIAAGAAAAREALETHGPGLGL